MGMNQIKTRWLTFHYFILFLGDGPGGDSELRGNGFPGNLFIIQVLSDVQ
jgi:hypothetical protein